MLSWKKKTKLHMDRGLTSKDMIVVCSGFFWVGKGNTDDRIGM